MDPIDALHNLMLMAFADGELAPEELDVLRARRVEWAISNQDFDRLLDEARSSGAELRIPESTSQRYDMLADMAVVMAADGKFSDFEKQLLAIAAVRMEISDQQLDEILDEFSDDDDELIIG